MAVLAGAGGGTSGKPTKPGTKVGQVSGSYTWDGAKWVVSSSYKPAKTGGTVVNQGSYTALKPKTVTALTKKLAAGGTKGTATAQQVAKAKAKLATPAPTKTATSTPVKTPKVFAEPVVTAPVDMPVDEAPVVDQPMDTGISEEATTDANTPVPWTLEGDPVYQAAMASGSSTFNMARNAALAAKQNAETQAASERQQLDVNAAENRRRLAGNYAARGMAGGAAGALTMAEAQANARQVADRTSIADQIAALNQDYLANYGAAGTDWTGTLMGQQYKTQAAQAAIQAQLAKYGVA